MSYLDRIDAAPAAGRWPMLRDWLYREPLPLFEELRAERPVLVLPELTFCTRHADCTLILRRHDSFGVDLYEPKQGDYFMAQDDTARHWREKSIMRAILDYEDIPALRAWVGAETARRLQAADGKVDFVAEIGRGVPVAMVQHWFGFDGADPKDMIEWSYWNQQDAFHNQPFDAPGPVSPDDIVANRKRAIAMMALFLGRKVTRRWLPARLGMGNDSISRLLRLSFTGAVKFNLKQVVQNAGGLLIGAVETTSHAVANALEHLTANPARLAAARAVADSPEQFDGFVFEALRFNPAFPYFFRTCHRPTVLAGGTPHAATVSPGTTVLAVNHSAMFDEMGFDRPTEFDPTRDHSDCFTFGTGIHECLGKAIATAMVPEIVRQVVMLPNLAAGALDHGGTKVPQHWQVTWH